MKRIQKQYPKTKRELTHGLLTELLSYDIATGDFYWRAYRPGMSKNMLAGTINLHGYRQLFICGKIYLAHRLAWFYAHGVWPAIFIDHIDENKQNNSLRNLREASHAENMHFYHSKRIIFREGLRLLPAFHF